MPRVIIITGGAGFIGSALVHHLLRTTDVHVVNVDKLTYAGNPASLADLAAPERHTFVQADIADEAAMRDVFTTYRPDGIIHLAAESHVDRSIDSPGEFIRTNVVGTYTLLQLARWWAKEVPHFRFHHVSTDEVYGDLGPDDPAFTEHTSYDPSSPYSASKAASDHLVRSWHRTFGLDTVVTNCSNNYGPRQFPEKLIPLMILNALDGRPLPVYGDGMQVRDWLFVDDHAEALWQVFERGAPGTTYNIGGLNEVPNIEVVRTLCALLDVRCGPRPGGASHADLITYVTDRPGHDRRYAIDASAIERDLGWRPRESFASGLAKTVDWYLANEAWWRPLRERYDRERLGTGR